MHLYLRDTAYTFWDIDYMKDHWFEERAKDYEYTSYTSTTNDKIHHFNLSL